jgi:hypothetical protein
MFALHLDVEKVPPVYATVYKLQQADNEIQLITK